MLNRVFQNPLWVRAICALAMVIIFKECLYVFSSDTRSHRRFGKDQLVNGLKSVGDKTRDFLHKCPCRGDESPFFSTGVDGVVTFNLNKHNGSGGKKIGLLATEHYEPQWYDTSQELPGKLKKRNEKIYAAAFQSQVKYAKRHGYRFTRMRNTVAKERSEQFSAGRLQQTLNPAMAQEARDFYELLHRFDTLMESLLEELRRPPQERVEWVFMVSENIYFANKEIALHEFLPPVEMPEINFLVAESGGQEAGIGFDIFGIRVHADSGAAIGGFTSYARWREQQGDAFTGSDIFTYMIHNKRHRKLRHMIATIPSRWINSEVAPSDDAKKFQAGDLAVHFNTVTIRHMNGTIQAILKSPDTYSKKLADSNFVKPSEFWAARLKAKEDAKGKTYDLRNRYSDLTQKADEIAHTDARWNAHIKAMDAIIATKFALLPTDVEVAAELLGQMEVMLEAVVKAKVNEESPPESKEPKPENGSSALNEPTLDEVKDITSEDDSKDKQLEEKEEAKAELKAELKEDTKDEAKEEVKEEVKEDVKEEVKEEVKGEQNGRDAEKHEEKETERGDTGNHEQGDVKDGEQSEEKAETSTVSATATPSIEEQESKETSLQVEGIDEPSP